MPTLRPREAVIDVPAGRRRPSNPIGNPPPPYTPPTLELLPAPDVTERLASSIQTRELTITGAKGVRTFACGEQWLAGKLQYFYYNPMNPGEFWYVLELCAGECDALIDVTCPGKVLSVGININYWWYPGTTGGTVDSHLTARDATWNEAFPGTCHAVVQLLDFGGFWQGQIGNLLFHQRCRKNLIPDTGVYTYSTNGWDQLYDFARWSEGKALPSSRIDTAAFVAAKAADVAAGRDNSCHMLLMEAGDPDDVIQAFRLILSTFWFWDDSNRFTVVPDRAGAAVAATYNDHHGSRSHELEGTRQDALDRPNRITIRHTDLTNGRQLMPRSYPALTVAIDNEIVEEHQLPWVYDPAIVDRLLIYLYSSFKYDLQVQDEWNDLTSARKLGDVVTLQIPSRGRNFTGRLVGRNPLPDNRYAVTLLEHNEAKFGGGAVSSPARTPSTFPDPGAAPDDVVIGSVTFTEELFADKSGSVWPRVRISIPNPASTYFDHVDVYVSINGGEFRYDGPAPRGRGATVIYLFNNVMEHGTGLPYTFKFVSISMFDIASAGVTAIRTISGAPVPADPQGFGAAANNDVAILTWLPVSDSSVTWELREGTTTDTWATAAPLGKLSHPSFIATPRYGATVRYFLKAVAYGQYSANAAIADVAFAAIGGQATESIMTWLPDSSFTRVVAFGNQFGTDPYTGLWVSGDLHVVVTQAPSGFFVPANPYSAMAYLSRSITPATINAEMAAAGLTTLAQWDAQVDDPRRGGQGLWAPLPANASGEIWGSLSTTFGMIVRLCELRARLTSVAHTGNDVPATDCIAQAIMVDDPANPTVKPILRGGVFPLGPEARVRGYGFRLASNNPFYQQQLGSVAGGYPFYGPLATSITQRSFQIQTGSATTDGSGIATITFSYPPLVGTANAKRCYTVRGIAGAAAAKTFVVDHLENTPTQTLRVKVYNDDGSVASGVSVVYELIDNGSWPSAGTWLP